jgi:UDP-2,3-diacylglucosamine hydrolase
VRGHSDGQKKASVTYADVDAPAALEWLQAANAETMIHGHTHRPGAHQLDARRQRIVLSDWDAAARPPRLEALRIEADATLRRVALA